MRKRVKAGEITQVGNIFLQNEQINSLSAKLLILFNKNKTFLCF